MKRKGILLALLLTLLLLGCGRQEEAEANSVFTEAFFADVVVIRDSRFGEVSGDAMEPVATYLKGLVLSAAPAPLQTRDDGGEQLYGLDILIFERSTGEEMCFLRNHEALTDPAGKTYVTTGENLNEGLAAAFGE